MKAHVIPLSYTRQHCRRNIHAVDRIEEVVGKVNNESCAAPYVQQTAAAAALREAFHHSSNFALILGPEMRFVRVVALRHARVNFNVRLERSG